jgi:hypothetical protein
MEKMTDGGIVEGSLTTEARAWNMEHDQQIQRSFRRSSSVNPLELILSGDLSWPWPLAAVFPQRTSFHHRTPLLPAF